MYDDHYPFGLVFRMRGFSCCKIIVPIYRYSEDWGMCTFQES